MLRRWILTAKPPLLIPQLHSELLRRNYCLSFFEPPYLELMKPKLPVYEAVTVQIKGYDFPPLESFHKFAHSVAEHLNLKVEECWPHPARHYSITKLKQHSTVVEFTYKLLMYERDIKMVNVPAVKLPLFVELIQAGLPAGTTLNVSLFDPEHYKDKFVPDHDLIAKRKELDELGGPPDDERENPFFQDPIMK